MRPRFLPVDTAMIPKTESWLLIGDYMWYMTHEQDIKQWAKECLDDYQTEGMIIKFVSSQDRSVFLLRWANGNI